jgi:hypothetical protein
VLRTGARPSKLIVLLLLGALGLAACGGGSSDSSSEKSTTTKAAPVGALDASSNDAAQAASVTAADVGAGWKQYQKAKGLVKIAAKDCITKFGSGIVAGEKVYSSALYQGASDTAFIYTTSYVFKTEAGAKAFTAMRTTADFTNCKQAADDAAQKTRDAETSVRVTQTTDPAVGTGGLDAFYVEQAYAKNTDGTEYSNATYYRYTYRVGRVVYVIWVDVGPAPDAASVETLSAQVNKAVADVKAAIDSRVQALNL